MIPKIFEDPRELLFALVEQGCEQDVYLLTIEARRILGDRINTLADQHGASRRWEEMVALIPEYAE